MKQFNDVPCKYGAPMGRQEFGHIEDMPERSINLFRVNFVDGDYDDGGAYWGGYPSQPIYCARGEDFLKFARANTRKEAQTLLEISDEQLIMGGK